MKATILNIEKLEQLKKRIKEEGYNNLHILSDFDRTLTYGSIDGIKTPSIISILRNGNYLIKGYVEKAHNLFNKYHPIEIDCNISLNEKKRNMQEWWESHNKLLIESGLSKSDLEDIVENGNIRFREGVLEFLDFIYKYNIPLIIFSASGCGDIIKMFFQKIKKDYSNIYYITNKFNWDKNGEAISSREPIIHCMNKDETILEKIPEIHKIIKNKRNVILLGDSMGDLGMIKGFNYKSLIKIGFLNFDYNKSKKEYQENFDVVLEGNNNFSYINKLVRDLK